MSIIGEETERHNERAVDSISEEPLISILIGEMISIVGPVINPQLKWSSVIRFMSLICLQNFLPLLPVGDPASKQQSASERYFLLHLERLLDAP